MTSKSRRKRPEKLPYLLKEKLSKTGTTRGAASKEIYQNRVSRSSTVLIPYAFWKECREPYGAGSEYENGFIVLVEPKWYFTTANADKVLREQGLALGTNAVLIFLKRADWEKYGMKNGSKLPNGIRFEPATSRLTPVNGVYIARIHATTSQNVGEIVEGFASKALRGAGIRVYEYASTEMINATKLQLEALVWLCHDADQALVQAGMTQEGAVSRRVNTMAAAKEGGLLDMDRLQDLRMVNENHHTVCPLCLTELSAGDFLRRTEQAAGREVYDLTTTEMSLFHIDELRVGKLQHKSYNLGWGHHHCNVVVKDAGIIPTLKWMKTVLDNNGDSWHEIDRQEQLVEEAVDL